MSNPSKDSAPIDVEDFIQSLDEYQPTIPDEVITYYLNRTGFSSPDVRVKRMIALAAQKFVSDVAYDALQYCKIRQQGQRSKDKKLILTIEDLQQALPEYGISIRKPEYFADKPSSSSTTTTTTTASNTNTSTSGKGKAPASTSST